MDNTIIAAVITAVAIIVVAIVNGIYSRRKKGDSGKQLPSQNITMENSSGSKLAGNDIIDNSKQINNTSASGNTTIQADKIDNLILHAQPELSPRADISLKVDERGEFGHSYGTRSSPFPNIQNSPNGFNDKGLPDWGSFSARIKISNRGFEKGRLTTLEVSREKTEMPDLFDIEKIAITFHPPMYIAARNSVTSDLYVDIAFAEHDPYKFALALKSLITTEQQYKIVFRYWSEDIEGTSQTQELCIEGDFKNFYQKVVEYWDGFGFEDLANLVRM